MKINAKTARGRRTKVYDSMGRLIGLCFYYDTNTREVGMYVSKKNVLGTYMVMTCKKNGKNRPMKVYAVWPGSYAMLDGKRL